MRIAFQRIGFDDFKTEIYHILKLFFEDVEITDGTAPDTGLQVTVAADIRREERSVHVTASVLQASPEGRREHTVERKLASVGGEEERREVKRAVGTALLQALQDATGIRQPWGILTGVRPMKLMHNLLMEQSLDRCRQILREEYLLSEVKVRLLSEIAERQLKVIPDLFRLEQEVSIYLGIPFCPTKCAYCTFPAYDIRGKSGSVAAYLEGLHHEIRETGRWLKQAGLPVTTVYWGGGTPTSIEAGQMDALFAALYEALPGMESVRELTVEAGRPDTITAEKIRVMKQWNVDRISINPQSFNQQTLDIIGRHHTVEETIEKFQLCRELGMNNINMDLIIGLPGEGRKELEQSLRETENLMPESLTVHTLSFKRASRMTQNRGAFEVADRDEIQQMMELTAEWTGSRGYHPYYMYRQKNILGNQENVGYARNGYESLYNILMMEERQTVLGLGCGAVSKILRPDQSVERFPNPKDPALYHQSFRKYTDKKLKLLAEVYGKQT